MDEDVQQHIKENMRRSLKHLQQFEEGDVKTRRSVVICPRNLLCVSDSCSKTKQLFGAISEEFMNPKLPEGSTVNSVFSQIILLSPL